MNAERFRERKLFRRYIDQQMTPDEFSNLEQRLSTDAAFRRRFVEYTDFEATLYEEVTRVAPVVEPPQPPAQGNWFWTTLPAALALSIVIALAAIWGQSHRELPAKTRFIEARLRGLKDVAVVTHAAGVKTDNSPRLQAGTRLKPGVLELESGRIQLQFLCGATVLVEGPAELHLLSPMSATVVHGTVSTKVPPVARGFVLNAPEAAIVDLGTQFGLNVNSLGVSEVHVQSGEVEASLLGTDGNTLLSERVLERATVLIDPHAGTMDRINAPRTQFPSILEPDHSALKVTSEYAEVIRQAKPLLYWRFEGLVNGAIPNEMGDKWAGRILAAPDESAAVQVRHGAVQFTASNGPRFIVADGLLPTFNRRSYSMELWIKPETFHWGALLNVMTPTELAKRDHLSFVELAYQTSLVHEPGVIRFLHRHPPGLQRGTNLFSQEICTPGRWHHVVVVKEPEMLKLFVNGQLVREHLGPAGNDEDSYRLLVGQLGGTTNERQYLGLIDELAVYPRPLSSEEVALHYYSMVPASANK